MRLSNSFFYTIREDVKDEETTSGKLLVRSGMIKKSSNGIYMFMPLGLKVLQNIEKIIRDEMNKAGSQELLMPALVPEEVYVKSGRRANFGDDMFTLRDRYSRAYALGPTHEELFALAAKEAIRSYKNMPFNLYQIQTKFRDERRPRFGLIRVREFIMKDAYSFDTDLAGLDKSYQIMYDTYRRIFDACGVDYKVVKADTGAMGGLLSEEFQALTDIGEDTLVFCPHCDYAANLEIAESVKSNLPDEPLKAKELIATPKAGTIEEVAKLLNEDPAKFVKTMLYLVDGKYYACLCPGDYEIAPLKLQHLLKAKQVDLATIEDVQRITNAQIGFAGPIKIGIPVIADEAVMTMHNFIVGANQTDYHYKNVNISDFEVSQVGDIKLVKEFDACPKCGKPIVFKKGIEIGNLFKLGDKYSKALDLTYLDKANQTNYVQMGSYGIGLGRVMAALAEQYANPNGIAWPKDIAPFKVGIVIIDTNNQVQVAMANELYQTLTFLGIDTVLDDRMERPGVKFNDLDLIGVPIKLVLGAKASESLVEYSLRDSDKVKYYHIDEAIEKIKEVIK